MLFVMLLYCYFNTILYYNAICNAIVLYYKYKVLPQPSFRRIKLNKASVKRQKWCFLTHKPTFYIHGEWRKVLEHWWNGNKSFCSQGTPEDLLQKRFLNTEEDRISEKAPFLWLSIIGLDMKISLGIPYPHQQVSKHRVTWMVI